MELNETERVYFVGIGGIGMAALARYYMSKGLPVAGYDRTPSALTAGLADEGAAISYADSMDAVPEAFRNPAGTLVVFTPACLVYTSDAADDMMDVLGEEGGA